MRRSAHHEKRHARKARDGTQNADLPPKYHDEWADSMA